MSVVSADPLRLARFAVFAAEAMALVARRTAALDDAVERYRSTCAPEYRPAVEDAVPALTAWVRDHLAVAAWVAEVAQAFHTAQGSAAVPAGPCSVATPDHLALGPLVPSALALTGPHVPGRPHPTVVLGVDVGDDGPDWQDPVGPGTPGGRPEWVDHLVGVASEVAEGRTSRLSAGMRLVGEIGTGVGLVETGVATATTLRNESGARQAAGLAVVGAIAIAGVRIGGAAASTLCGPAAPVCNAGVQLGVAVVTGRVASAAADAFDSDRRRAPDGRQLDDLLRGVGDDDVEAAPELASVEIAADGLDADRSVDPHLDVAADETLATVEEAVLRRVVAGALG